MFEFLFGRSLDKVLYETKTVKVKGVKFKIKKINPLDYLDGSKVMLQYYDTWKLKKGSPDENKIAEKKVKEHLSEVLVAGVVSPVLVFKKEGEEKKPGEFYVDDLFFDIEIVNKLYEAIMLFTYGKKKANF